MNKNALDRYLSQSDEDAHPEWFEDHPKPSAEPEWFEDHPEDQVLITFPKEVTQFMTGDYESSDEVTLPLFRALNPEDEAAFRKHARENYVIGEPINSVYHPVWRDEARKMNVEASGGSRVDQP